MGKRDDILISEAVSRLMLNEAPDYEQLRALADKAVERGISDEVGDRGPLMLERGDVDIHDGNCHLVRLCDIYGEKVGGRYQVKSEFKAETARIHKNYADAMATHHPESVRDIWTMENSMMNRRYAFTDGDSCIFMFDKGTSRGGFGATGYWLVTHFAPSSNIAGFKLLRELFHYDNIIMAVTEHMWPQLAKMGLVYPEFTAMVPFAGGMSEKMFFTTDKELMKSELMKGLENNMKNGTASKMELGLLLMTPGLYDSIHSKKDMERMVKESVRSVISKMLLK